MHPEGQEAHSGSGSRLEQERDQRGSALIFRFLLKSQEARCSDHAVPVAPDFKENPMRPIHPSSLRLSLLGLMLASGQRCAGDNCFYDIDGDVFAGLPE